jgi:hypothetical protein
LLRSRVSLHLEIIALRHQLAVVHRSRRPRLRLTSVDRALWAWLAHAWSGWRSGGAHRHTGDRRRVAPARISRVLDVEEPTSHRPPAVPHDVRALIRDMSTANPLWGARGFTGNC